MATFHSSYDETTTDSRSPNQTTFQAVSATLTIAHNSCERGAF